MQIDWFTFGAQIVNFLILLVLLRRFLYGPITKAMDAREVALVARFEEAERESSNAQAEAERYRRARGEMEEEHNRLFAAAATEADRRRKSMIEDARSEVESMMTRWYDEVDRERATFLADARERLAQLLVLVADRALADLADVTLEAKMVDRFVDRLLHLPAYQRMALVESGADLSEDVVIATSFDLSYPQRQQLIEAIQRLLVEGQPLAVSAVGHGDEIGVRFERNTALQCGIELLVRERRVAWSLRDYVDALADEIGRSLLPLTT